MYASLCANVYVWCEKCKVSNWFGDVSFMHFFMRMDNVHIPCINVYVLCTLLQPAFILSASIPHLSPLPPLLLSFFHLNFCYRCHTIKKNTETISNCKHIFRIQSHCMMMFICVFFARVRWGTAFFQVWRYTVIFVLKIPLFDVHFI